MGPVDIAEIVRASALREMAWANGAGITYDVAVSPAGAGLADFDWRISLADISVDGDFSVLPGVDRVLVLIEGEGMDLTVAGQTRALEPWTPVNFAGEAAASCTLPHGPTRDLNLMCRRSRVAGSVEILPGASVLDVRVQQGETVWLGVLAGAWATEAEPDLALGPRDFIRIDRPITLVGHGLVARVGLHARPTVP